MNQRGFTLRLFGHRYSFGMPNTLADQITGGDRERLQEPIDVLELSVVEDGFLFVTANDAGEPAYELKYEPSDFPGFRQCIQTIAPWAWAATLKLDTPAAAAILHLFYHWINYKFAEIAEKLILKGEMTFEDVREIRSEAFQVPRFQRFFSESFVAESLPKRTKGKRRKHNPAIEDLYALACRIYKESPNLSWEAACFEATNRRADLVPASWRHDPEGNLKREAARYWDGSRYSQKDYRERRDT
ncbi:hypothetical protein [Pseudomonas citronellolis]|uniref:hypothetical protein n=1 Tax=Pseudomonas citronellolis TaxID=53408 RepID=UPI0011C0DD9F|nr:hypothetical protein [Pseudomonas citronellolis]